MADDAAVYRLTDDIALVQTVDFLTPVVDDPYTYGLIAAANALSDVYAMGAQPLNALNIVTFPTEQLSIDVLAEVLRGGADKAREAGAPIVGGHTVDGDEPTYGLAVTGTVSPTAIVQKHGARPGDVLVLTKPLGSGVVTTALKGGRAQAAHVKEAVAWMARLNRSAAEAMVEAPAHAATDVTGFGLLGHLLDMARGSHVAVELEWGAIPFLTGAAQYADTGLFSRGGASNAGYVEPFVEWRAEVTIGARRLLADPQTSGGLLMAVPPDRAGNLVAQLEAGGDLGAVIGRIVDGEPGRITVC